MRKQGWTATLGIVTRHSNAWVLGGLSSRASHVRVGNRVVFTPLSVPASSPDGRQT